MLNAVNTHCSAVIQAKLVPVCLLDGALGGLAACLQAGTHSDPWHMVHVSSLLAYLSPGDLDCNKCKV